MQKILTAALAALALMAPKTIRTQTGDDQAAAKNAAQARAALNAMVQALGGQAWLGMKNQMTEGQVGAYETGAMTEGTPNLGTTLYFDFHQWPDHDRIELTKHRDVVELYVGRQAWEVTYRGKKPLDKDIADDFMRRRDHSIETAIKVWMKDPNTILIYEGQHLAERHLAEQVTLISAQNEAITILIDAQTHLPLQRTFQWRDAVYHDKDTDTEEYDDYHTIGGFPTPFTVTRLKNGAPYRQYFLTRVKYNQILPADFWDPDAEARKIRNK